MKKEQLKTHWVADIFPLNQTDVDAIAKDISENGQQLPILALEDGRIVDGRNRWLACQKIGVEPIIETIPQNNGKPPTDEKLVVISLSMNGKRRQLSAGQRACAAAEVINQLPEAKGGRGKTDDKLSTTCTEFSAGRVNTKNALTLLRNDRARFDRVKMGEPMDPVYKEWKADKEAQAITTANIVRLEEDYPELHQRVSDGKLSVKEAMTLADNILKERQEADYAKKVAMESRRDLLERVAHLSSDNKLEDLVEASELFENPKKLKPKLTATVKMLTTIIAKL